MTFGVLWTVTAVCVVVFAAPYVLRPTTDRPVEVGDRFVACIAVGLAAGWAVGSGAANALGSRTSMTADTAFWAAALGVSAAYVGPARKRAFVPVTARLADLAPWVLAAYGTYLGLCWLRGACSALGGGGPEPGAVGEAVAGAALVAAGVALHRAWPLTESQRVAAAVLALAAFRLALSPVAGRPVTAAAGAVVGCALIWGAARKAVRSRQYSTVAGHQGPRRSRPEPNNDSL